MKEDFVVYLVWERKALFLSIVNKEVHPNTDVTQILMLGGLSDLTKLKKQ